MKVIFGCDCSNRMEADEAVAHQWLDVGHHLHQKSDEIVFPAVNFHELVSRLDSLKAPLLKVEPVTW